MKRFLPVLTVAAALVVWLLCAGGGSSPAGTTVGDGAFTEAFDEGLSGTVLHGEGTVDRLLEDDLEGTRHQRFIVRLRSGQTLLVSHNIDIAPRIEELEAGDMVEFTGEYEWNPEDGLVHWTHHDPDRSHEDGWILHEGRTYR